MTLARTRVATGGALLTTAVLLVALNLRAPIVSVSAVIEQVRADLALSAGVAGLLTSLPVLCFAVLALPASWLIARLGVERAMLVGLGVLTAGTLLRSVDGAVVALGGTLLIGAGVTVGNVVLPVVIGRDFPHRSGTLLAAYAAVMNTGSMITLALTVPLASGTGWRWALAAWAVVTGVAALVWWVATRHRSDDARTADGGVLDRPGWWRRPSIWGLLLAFGGQSFSYYGMTAWLPELLSDVRGLGEAAASAASSLFQVAAVAGAVVVALVRSVTGSLRAAFTVVAACFLALPIGLLVAPGGWAVWCALGGVAQGGLFTVVFSAVIARARDSVDNRRIAALVQGGGYALGALGPSVVGTVHEVVGGWTAPLLVVTGALTVLAVAGFLSVGGIGPAPRAATQEERTQ